MSDNNEELAIIDGIYAAAMEPERFDELVDIWHEKLKASGVEGFKLYPGDAERLYSHSQRADTILSLVSDNQSVLPPPIYQRINSEPRPTLVVDASGKIHALNEACEKSFKLKSGQNISDWISEPDYLEQLSAAVRKILSDQTAPEKAVPELVRIWTDSDTKQVLLSLSSWLTASGRKFALIQSSSFVWPSSLSPTFSEAFDLTSAEIDVVKLIIEGASIQDVADQRGSLVSTVRSQIKSIYAKTGTRNQSEFLRMTLGLATLNLRDQNSVVGAYLKPGSATEEAWPLPEHQRLLSLSDGRILDYADCGPADGLPCIYLHNDFLGNIWPKDAAAAATMEGLRIIVPARAYYGRSSAYPEGAINYDQTADDIAALLDHLKIDRALHVSVSTGGMFALALADKYPDRCAGQVTMAPAFAVTSSDEEKNMPKFYRFMNSVVKRYPRLLETILKMGLAYHNRVGTVRYLERILGDVPADISVIKDEANFGSIVRALEFSSTNGHLGVFHDYKSILPDNIEKFRRLPFPVFAIIGDEDRNSRLLRANRLIEAGMNISKVMAKGGGAMLLYTHGELVVQTIKEAWRLDLDT